MSLLTTYRNTLHGATGEGEMTLSVIRNFAGSGTTMADFSANDTDTTTTPSGV